MIDDLGGLLIPREASLEIVKLLKEGGRIDWDSSFFIKSKEHNMKLVTFRHCTLNVDQIVRLDYTLKTLSEELSLADIHGVEVEIFTSDGKVLVMEEDADLDTVSRLFRTETMGEKHDMPYYIERYLEYTRVRVKNLREKK